MTIKTDYPVPEPDVVYQSDCVTSSTFPSPAAEPNIAFDDTEQGYSTVATVVPVSGAPAITPVQLTSPHRYTKPAKGRISLTRNSTQLEIRIPPPGCSWQICQLLNAAMIFTAIAFLFAYVLYLIQGREGLVGAFLFVSFGIFVLIFAASYALTKAQVDIKVVADSSKVVIHRRHKGVSQSTDFHPSHVQRIECIHPMTPCKCYSKEEGQTEAFPGVNMYTSKGNEEVSDYYSASMEEQSWMAQELGEFLNVPVSFVDALRQPLVES